MNQREGSGNALGWRDILVLAVEVVLPAELARSSFITFLLSRTTVVTGLGGAHLPSSYLLCGAIVRGLRVGCDRRSVLLGWWWRLCIIWRSVGVCSRTGGVVVSIGYAAIGAAVLCFGLVIPGMSQTWFVGPIAEETGDIGFEVALVLSAVLYVPFRALERKKYGR